MTHANRSPQGVVPQVDSSKTDAVDPSTTNCAVSIADLFVEGQQQQSKKSNKTEINIDPFVCWFHVAVLSAPFPLQRCCLHVLASAFAPRKKKAV